MKPFDEYTLSMLPIKWDFLPTSKYIIGVTI